MSALSEFAEGLDWPPTADQYYLSAGTERPVMQGDIFDNVPFIKAKRGSKVGDPPNHSIDRRLVAILGYPCDIYEHGKLVRVQMVAPVVDASRAGVPPDWDGALNMSPLPDLLGDGRMFAVDLRVGANIDSFYLDRVNRKRSLSELGWAAFRQRLGLSSTRLLNHLSDLVGVGSEVWAEISLWQQWTEAGRAESKFQAWLDEREANLGGFTRRSALSRGMVEVIRTSLEQELSRR